MTDEPMDRPPRDHGSDRYDYVELQNAPPGVAPWGAWWDKLLAEACPDCRANIFARWTGDPRAPWAITLAHDETCPSPLVKDV